MSNATWDGDLSPFVSGGTEPWSVSVLQALVRLKRPKRLLELGSYEGRTTRALASVMPRGASLVGVEAVSSRWEQSRLAVQENPQVTILETDALKFLRTHAGPPFNFVFVDDDHSAGHVALELDLLLDGIVAPGGLIVGHDVRGAFNLAPLFEARGGFIIELPRLHAAGSLGVIEVPA